MRQSRGEAAYLIVACSGCLGVFHGLGVQSKILETAFIVGGILAALVLLLVDLRNPRRLILSLIAIPLLVILGYGLARGIFWLFMTYLPARGEPIIKLGP
jgi:uncharacterized oligopeptide transporter (OPT) family protein